MPNICPVIHELSSDNKNFATEAESLPSPILFKGCILAILSAIFSFLSKKFEIFEFVRLGAIQFILTFGASSAAKAKVKPSIAPFADETIAWFGKPCLTATVENKTIEPLFFSSYLLMI